MKLNLSYYSHKLIKIWNFRNHDMFKLITLWVLFLPFFIVMIMYAINEKWAISYIPKWLYIVFLVIDTILIFYLVVDYFKTYLEIFRRIFTMDLLIAFGIHISYIYSVVIMIINVVNKGYEGLGFLFFEVPIALATFINLGHFLENKLQSKTNIGIKDLLALQNVKAQKINKNNKLIKVSSYDLKPNDLILIQKGQSVPVDGIILEGKSYLDFSSLNGEPLPKEMKIGDIVLSGTINLGQSLKVKVIKNVNDSTLSAVIHKLEKILNTKTSIERFSSKLVKYFIPTILIVALISFIAWTTYSYFFGANNLPSFFLGTEGAQPTPVGIGIWVAVSVIVVGCPCAFGIAAPSAIYAASGVAAKNKILFASAEIYEKLKKVKYVAFDKTGTLTQGTPHVLSYHGDRNVLAIAAALEQHSHHPLAKTIAAYYESNLKLEKIEEIEGKGIQGIYQNDFYQIASYFNLLKQNYKSQIKLNTDQPATYVAVAKNKVIIGVYVIGDAIKEDSFQVIENLHKLKIKTVVLSGDNQNTVNYVAKQLNITLGYGDLSPQDKVNQIELLKKEGEVVFVGDGLNDLLAMQTANLGMSFSSGSDITNAMADVSLLETDLNLVYKTIHIAKSTLLTVKTNFIWAALFNFSAIPLAAFGIIPPWMAAILMILSDLLLLINTLWFKQRILKFCAQTSKNIKAKIKKHNY